MFGSVAFLQKYDIMVKGVWIFNKKLYTICFVDLYDQILQGPKRVKPFWFFFFAIWRKTCNYFDKSSKDWKIQFDFTKSSSKNEKGK